MSVSQVTNRQSSWYNTHNIHLHITMEADDNLTKRPKNKKQVKRKVKRDRKRDKSASGMLENIGGLGKL